MSRRIDSHRPSRRLVQVLQRGGGLEAALQQCLQCHLPRRRRARCTVKSEKVQGSVCVFPAFLLQYAQYAKSKAAKEEIALEKCWMAKTSTCALCASARETSKERKAKQ